MVYRAVYQQNILCIWLTQPSVERVECHIREGIFAGDSPWSFTNFYTEDKERVDLNSLEHHDLFYCEPYILSALRRYFMRFYAINHVEDRCGNNFCADFR